ncbi:MAG: MFS transporter [Rhodobacterales bacterium CG18_big_fil_WC_8_21_14_2_50_71_9]|nr:MAG: MFS transporter [Rhodobacterales bacterium CG18_big_fil_WC_8_21_14_2_50_71_9]PIY73867.1 MAG: MFS transporter [Rhodobacterales bacterium CG_4_10_14_0_8_um_filter_70_9]
MSGYRRMMLGRLARLGPRFLPFADVASEKAPLSRLLRLSLFQVSVGMALVLLVGTLNRVMIVELSVPASVVGVMLALPVLFAPFRALIGFKSDNHRSAFGWRRVPYIWKGTLLQFGGFAVMPFALLVLSGYNEAHDLPPWIGQASAGVAFLLVGAGLHMVQTVGLALATDLVDEADQPRVVGLMYVMLLVGMIVSAFVFGLLLDPYNPGRLVQVIQGAAVLTVALNGIALWKQEARDPVRAHAMKTAPTPRFADAWRSLARVAAFRRLLVVIALGTAGFGMADVLLEPFGGQILAMSVAATTRLSMALAFGSLLGFGYASRTLARGASPLAVSGWGALIGVGAFALVIGSASALAAPLLALATVVAGVGAGLFSHGTLTASMRAAPRNQIGLALGAWGAVQTTAAGVAIAVGGVIRDVIVAAPVSVDPATPYLAVFAVEIALLALALAATWRMMARDVAVARGQ